MLYSIFKIPASVAFWIYCRKIIINNKTQLHAKGPLIIAANHPNSFLDAIIITTLFRQPVYSLARGDAFKNKWANKILRSLKMLPVYRISEGADNVGFNYKTFEACYEIFKQNGTVLIFSEGISINEWHLRPLKKGTAKLALSSWQQGLDLKIIPLGINYAAFYNFGKIVHLNLGKTMDKTIINELASEGSNINSFNNALQKELKVLVYEATTPTELKDKFSLKKEPLKQIVLFPFAVAGFVVHWPLYTLIKLITKRLLKDFDHYDSVITGSLFLSYLFYLILYSCIISSIVNSYWGLTTFIIMPFLAWSYVQLKK